MADKNGLDYTFPQIYQDTTLGRLRLRIPVQEPIRFPGQWRREGDEDEGYAWLESVYSELRPRVGC